MSSSYHTTLSELVQLANQLSTDSSSTNDSTYDRLDFQRPLSSLQGHYHSSRTLKSINSQDYLNPIEVTDL